MRYSLYITKKLNWWAKMIWLAKYKDAFDGALSLIKLVLFVGAVLLLGFFLIPGFKETNVESLRASQQREDRGSKYEVLLLRLGVLKDMDCIGNFQKVVEIGARLEAVPREITDELNRRCNTESIATTNAATGTLPMSEIEVAVLNTIAVQEKTVAAASESQPLFVAIGKAAPMRNSDVFFNNLDGNRAIDSISYPSNGDVLEARWNVNVRGNTDLTTGESNPSLGLLTRGQCVELLENPKAIRETLWVMVSVLDECSTT